MTTRGYMYRTTLIGAAVVALLVGATSVGAQAGPSGAAAGTGASGDRGASYWTPARRAAAQPRDLVIDERGLGYLQRADGTLEPYGHSVAAAPFSVRAIAPAGSTKPQVGPPSGGDGEAPQITGEDPIAGSTIGAAYPFRATVTDGDGIKSVNFVLTKGSSSMSYSASHLGSNVYGINFVDFTDGGWEWKIAARDNSKGGGTTSNAGPFNFTVDTSGSTSTTEPPPTTQPPLTDPCDNSGTATVVNDQWTCGGKVQTAAGRIYFEMPAKGPRWSGYVCSGTVVQDGLTGTSVILTAAHCVYDDVNGVFARNVMFIPNQAGTDPGAGTDRNCDNDPLGCWKPSHGVVDIKWTESTFPANIPWDYAYYVVSDTGAHTGIKGSGGALDVVAGALPVDFSAQTLGPRTHALGYSYSDDPNFMYCAEGLGSESTYGDYWLASCGLSGGASGGPWIQPMVESTGIGPIISVNSWGYRGSPGMAGPPLDTTAKCVFDARTGGLTQDRGVVAICP